ncbi:MAG: hypothetical protein AAFV98_03295, partial [Chloroflexota bacterium]
MPVTRPRFIVLVMAMAITLLGVFVVTAQDNPDGFPTPENVVVAGTIQDELGCSGEWQPECTETALTLNEDSGLYEGTFSLPAGSYEYKIALDLSWERNYGANAEFDGANIALELAEDTDVKFTYDHSTGVVNDSVNGDAVVVDTPAEESVVEIPELVNIPGTIQPFIGCSGEWAPDCQESLLTYDEAYDIWEGTYDLPAGNYEYKVAINGSWDENYGAFADAGGPNIILPIAEDSSVTFLYDHSTNWIMDTVRQRLVTAAGSFQDEIGCANEWAPDCMLSWMQDVDGDGLYTFTTSELPAGEYEVKAAINRSWDENYGAGGEADGANIAFTVAEDGDNVTFAFDSASNMLVVSVGGTAVSGSNLREQRAHWVTADTFAWNVEADEELDYRLLYSADASLSVSLTGLQGEFETFDLSINSDGL